MYLDVGKGHRIYYETYGNPEGIDVLFIHGGPGLGFSDADKAIFDPEKFHVIFMDQRGCGKSTPKGSIKANTTNTLLADMKRVLEKVSLDKVVVFGGSWGATLGVLFAATYPEHVKQLILRGFFSATRQCVDIYLRGKIGATHPEEWHRLLKHIPMDQKQKVPEYVFGMVTNKNEGYQELALEWARYGLSLSRKKFQRGEVDKIMSSKTVDYERISIELHYALNSFFIDDNHVYDQAQKISNIPCTIVHGKYDYICPLKDAEQLHQTLENSKLITVDGGHSLAEMEVKAAVLNELNQI